MSWYSQLGRLGQVDVLGVFVEPAAFCLLAGLAITLGLRRELDRIGIDDFVWNRPLFDLCLLVTVTALLVLALRVPGA